MQANTAQPSFDGVDFTQYRNWEKVTLPNGRVGYVVPSTGYILDPFLSSQKGKPVLFRDVRKEQQAQQQAIDEQKAAQQQQLDLQKQAASPAGQLLPVAGSVGGLVAANYLANGTLPAFMGGAGAAGTAAGTAAAGTAGAAGAGTIAAGAAPAVPTIVGAAPIGGSAAATGSAGAGITGASSVALPAAAAIYGTYRLSRMWQHLRDSEGGWSGAKQGFKEGLKPANMLATGLIGSPLIGGLMGLFGHKSTDQWQHERWDNLFKNGAIDEQTREANEQLRQQDDHIWKDGPFAGKKWNMEDAMTLAKQDPVHFRGVFGNYKTFGKDWGSYTPDQQDAIVANLVNEGLYKSDKGDILITNESRARQIKDQVLAGQLARPDTGTPATPAPTNSTPVTTKSSVKPVVANGNVESKPITIQGAATAPQAVPVAQPQAAVAPVAAAPAAPTGPYPVDPIHLRDLRYSRPQVLGQQLAMMMNQGR